MTGSWMFLIAGSKEATPHYVLKKNIERINMKYLKITQCIEYRIAKIQLEVNRKKLY